MGVKSIVLDSVPVIVAPTWRSIRGTPEQILTFVYMTLIALFWRFTSVLAFWFWEPYNDGVQKDLHDPNLLPADTRKSYIFPERDVMWAWDRPVGNHDNRRDCARDDTSRRPPRAERREGSGRL